MSLKYNALGLILALGVSSDGLSCASSSAIKQEELKPQRSIAELTEELQKRALQKDLSQKSASDYSTKNSTITPATPSIPKLASGECDDLDLTEKIGFKGSYVNEKNIKLCYQISENIDNGGNQYESIHPCSSKIPRLGFYRVFAGPQKGTIEVNYAFVKDNNGNMGGFRYWRDIKGNISSLPGQPELPNLNEIFDFGSQEIDLARNHPNICPQLQSFDHYQLPKK